MNDTSDVKVQGRSVLRPKTMTTPTGDEPALSQPEPDDNAPSLGGVAAVAHALEALHADDLLLRGRAARVLAQHGDASLSGALGHALLSPDNTARSAERIAGALAAIGGGRAEALLLDALYAQHSDAQLGVISALGGFDSLNVIAPLIVLLGHPLDALRERARSALQRIGAEAVEPLVETLTRDMHWLKSRMRGEARFAALVEETAQVYLEQRLRHPRWSLHFSVAWQRTAELLRLIGACGAGLSTGEQRLLYDTLAAYLDYSRYWDYALTGIAHLHVGEATATLRAMVEKREGPRGSRAAALLAQHTPRTWPTLLAIAEAGTPAGRANLQGALPHLNEDDQHVLRAQLGDAAF